MKILYFGLAAALVLLTGSEKYGLAKKKPTLVALETRSKKCDVLLS